MKFEILTVLVDMKISVFWEVTPCQHVRWQVSQYFSYHVMNHIVTCMSDYNGVWIGNWIIEHLLIVTTSNYSAIANSRTLQFTTTRTKSSQSAVSSLVVTC
jgi:hypothetical protein